VNEKSVQTWSGDNITLSSPLFAVIAFQTQQNPFSRRATTLSYCPCCLFYSCCALACPLQQVIVFSDVALSDVSLYLRQNDFFFIKQN